MSKKKIQATLYMESKLLLKEWRVEHDPGGYLFAGGRYRTKILPADLPEWYVYGYLYKRHGYISAKDVKHLLYVPDYAFSNHLHKYDTLLISYDEDIEPFKSEDGFSWYKGYKHAIGGPLIVNFVEAVGKHSNYDVAEIRKELKRKREWYDERNSS